MELFKLGNECNCDITFLINEKSMEKPAVFNPSLAAKRLAPESSFALFLHYVAIKHQIVDNNSLETLDALKKNQLPSYTIKKKVLRSEIATHSYGNGLYDGGIMKNDITEKSTKISPKEQLNIIKQIKETHSVKYGFENDLKKGLLREIHKDYKLYHFTTQNWMIGWIEQNEKNYYFSGYITNNTLNDSERTSFQKQVISSALRAQNLYDAPELKRKADSAAAAQKILADTNYTLRTFYSNNPNLQRRVDEIISKMTTSQLAGQMIVPAAGRWGNSASDIEKAIKQGKIGGLLLLKGEKNEFIRLVKKYNQMALDHGTFPLIYSADAEPSLFNGKIKGTPWVQKTNTILSHATNKKVAQTINAQLKSIGIQHNYAPDCDLGINKAIIGNRSYGNDTKAVAALAGSFIKQSTSDQIVTTAKHFPGHGLVKGDSHLNLVVIDGEMKELDTYKRLIKDSVLSIMVGHIAIKNNPNYSTHGTPSSCSRKVVTGLLRKDLGFEGLIITDGMGMGALKQLNNAPLMAVKAGCDLILMAPNHLKLHEDIVKEMNNNESFRNQIRKSVKRIVRLKICLGIMK